MLSSFSHFSSPFPSQSIIIERSKTSSFKHVFHSSEKKVCAQLFDLEKHYKIWYVYVKRKHRYVVFFVFYFEQHMNALVCVNLDQGIHKVKLKVARNEKKVLGFSFYKNIANIEACLLQLKKLSTNLFFWRVCCLHLVYLHTSISTCILWPAAIITDEWLSGTWLGCYTTEY